MVREGFGRYWSPADKGGDVLYDLSSSEKYKDNTGEYFDNDKGGFGKAHQDAYNNQAIERLIRETDEILNPDPN